MAVNHMRIDDRLIHGQIVTAWIKDSGANSIVVADELASKDATQKMLLQFATPKAIKLVVENLDNALKHLNETNDQVLLLVRNATAALYLFENGLKVETLNVGNISNSNKGGVRKSILPYIHLGQEDVESLTKINEMGINLDVRAVPSDRSIKMMDSIKKL